jgi:putative polyketide hydroxylase
MMFYGYGHGEDGAAAGYDVLDGAVRVGHRFPHRFTSDGVSTLDIVPSHWTLFTSADQQRWRAEVAALPVTPRVHRLTGLDGAVLVRPDGFVAWHGDTGASLRWALHRLLGVAPSDTCDGAP